LNDKAEEGLMTEKETHAYPYKQNDSSFEGKMMIDS
jgi:hypothetical protein